VRDTAALYSTVRRFLFPGRVESCIYFWLIESSDEAGFLTSNLLFTKAESNSEMGFSVGYSLQIFLFWVIINHPIADAKHHKHTGGGNE